MKKGFTLLEMIAVILIIGMLILTVFPLVANQIKSQSGKIDETTKTLIYSAAELYVKERKSEYPSTNGAVYCDLTLKKLIEDGKLKRPLKNFKNGKELDEQMVVKIMVNTYLEYEYELVDASVCQQQKTETVQENVFDGTFGFVSNSGSGDIGMVVFKSLLTIPHLFLLFLLAQVVEQ